MNFDRENGSTGILKRIKLHKIKNLNLSNSSWIFLSNFYSDAIPLIHRLDLGHSSVVLLVAVMPY